MAISMVLPPNNLAVELETIKQHLRIDHAEDDDYLSALARAATDHVERHLRQALINRTYRQYLDTVPASGCIALEYWPVQHIEAVTGFDHDGNPTLFDPSDYRLDVKLDPVTVIFLASGNASNFENGIEIDFIAGYGPVPSDMPSNLVHAILMIIAHWYEFRGASITETRQSLPFGIEKLLDPVRRVHL